VLVTDAAKKVNARAGEILQRRDLGMEYIDEDNHTPEPTNILRV
jgi:hypothetical protein